jgi:hypothetical protein
MQGLAKAIVTAPRGGVGGAGRAGARPRIKSSRAASRCCLQAEIAELVEGGIG